MKETNIIALDVGTKRVGVARASSVARFPGPLTTLNNDDNFWRNLAKLLDEENVTHIVVGLPRNLQGDHTDQTSYTENFVNELTSKVKIPITIQDEAVTSIKAEEELNAKGKNYTKADIDALAATYILEDYLASQKS